MSAWKTNHCVIGQTDYAVCGAGLKYLPMTSRIGSVLVCCLVLATGGCTTMSGDWGSRATLSPGWDRVRQSARDAAASPHTWAPLIGAAVFAIHDFDEQTVAWATDKNPLFGNIDDAGDASDMLSDLSTLNHAVSVLVVPSRSAGDKAKAVALGIVAGGINDAVTSGLKSWTGRRRPDERSYNSFPSMHTSGSTFSATLAAHNVEFMPGPERRKRIWTWTSYSIAGLTGWARVEGKRHFPSDILAGYALGHFLGAFFDDAFIEPRLGPDAGLRVSADPSGRLLVNFTVDF